jgi:hypothetical protein
MTSIADCQSLIKQFIQRSTIADCFNRMAHCGSPQSPDESPDLQLAIINGRRPGYGTILNP